MRFELQHARTGGLWMVASSSSSQVLGGRDTIVFSVAIGLVCIILLADDCFVFVSRHAVKDAGISREGQQTNNKVRVNNMYSDTVMNQATGRDMARVGMAAFGWWVEDWGAMVVLINEVVVGIALSA
jgi:hypothetical protein